MKGKAPTTYLMPVHATQPGKEPDPLGFALSQLSNGKQSRASFELIAQHVIENYLQPHRIRSEAVAWLATALAGILNGVPADRALGRLQRRGRADTRSLLNSRVAAFIELKVRAGATKNRAIGEASTAFHRDVRHIERLLTGKMRWDFTAIDDRTLEGIVKTGIEVVVLGDAPLGSK